jgi:hypothetical protein
VEWQTGAGAGGKAGAATGACPGPRGTVPEDTTGAPE